MNLSFLDWAVVACSVLVVFIAAVKTRVYNRSVADAADLSRRSLERHFRKALGCSILRQIRLSSCGVCSKNTFGYSLFDFRNWGITELSRYKIYYFLSKDT